MNQSYLYIYFNYLHLVSSLNTDLEHTLDIKQGSISLQQNEGSLDMDTENTVTTASASTTTLQDSLGQEKLHSDALLADKVTSIKTEADLVESDTTSVRSDSMHAQQDGIKQEPMSVDSVPPNMGKDLAYKSSDSATTPVSSSYCQVAPLGSAPVRWSKPKRGTSLCLVHAIRFVSTDTIIWSIRTQIILIVL